LGEGVAIKSFGRGLIFQYEAWGRGVRVVHQREARAAGWHQTNLEQETSLCSRCPPAAMTIAKKSFRVRREGALS
jgi:hypothetical protein